jgi:hypothetical protein
MSSIEQPDNHTEKPNDLEAASGDNPAHGTEENDFPDLKPTKSIDFPDGTAMRS